MSLWRMIWTAISLVGVRLGGAAMGLVSQILLARILPQNEVGIVLMCVSFATIISLLMTGGYSSLTMTILPRYYALGRLKLAEAFHRAVWNDGLILTCLMFVIVGAIYVWAPLDPALKTALAFGCLMAPAAALIRISSSAANSRRRFQLSYIPDFIFRPGLLLAFLAPCWLLGVQLGLSAVLWVIIAIAFAVALGQAWILGKSVLPKTLRAGRHDLAPRLRGRAFSMVIISAVAMSFADFVTLIGGFFLPPDSVAELGIAIRLAALAGFITQVTQNFVLPDLSAAIVKGNRASAEALIFRINAISLAAIAGCVLASALFGPLILGVFGADYKAAHWPLVLFMISQLFRAAGGMNQHLLSLNGFQARSASACVFSIAILVAAAVMLTPAYGVMGMGVAVILADAAWAGILGLQAQRYSGYRGDIFAGMGIPRQPAE
jgi:O-antigen/teichoic acid export membrane protein